MSYKKMLKTKIVRCEHVVTWKIGVTLIDNVRYDLTQIPSGAKLVDFNEADEAITLTFLQEVPESQDEQGGK